MNSHHLKASAETCHRGFFDAARKPVLTINSGDCVRIDTLTGVPQFIRSPAPSIPPELQRCSAVPSASGRPAHPLPARSPSRERNPDMGAGGPHHRRGAAPGLGLQHHAACCLLYAASPFPRVASHAYSARLGAQRWAPARGPRAAACAFLRHHGRRPAEGVGPHHVDRAGAHGGNLDNKEPSPEQRSTCLCSSKAACSLAVTATAHRATARCDHRHRDGPARHI